MQDLRNVIHLRQGFGGQVRVLAAVLMAAMLMAAVKMAIGGGGC